MSDSKSIASRLRDWNNPVRLYSGVVLFVFAATHLLNHSIGLVSLDAMEAVREVRAGFWRSLPGTVLLAGAMVLHVMLALGKFAQRRSWRVKPSEAVQLVFGLAIPLLLVRHMLGTRLPHELFGVDDNYRLVLSALWPGQALNMAMLVVLVWVHGCLGLHFWWRIKPWYAQVRWPLFAVAVLVPALAYAGFTVAGRAVLAEASLVSPYTQEQYDFLIGAMGRSVWISLAVIAAVLAYRVLRMVLDRFRPRVRVTYAEGRQVMSEVGPTLLEISRNNDIPHAAVCGGRARCSTCRVRVLDGGETLAPPEETEQRVLERVGAAENVRLACQLVPASDLTVAPLLPARRVLPADTVQSDKYLWGVEQTVAVMFADIRDFTTFSESRLPYDVVFVLNQYLGQMSDAIEDAGGYVDKFIGDGIMAIFGMEQGAEAGSESALRAAKAMGGVLQALNRTLAADLDNPISIGIGIHTGPAILGRIGGSGGGGASQNITALGDTVNTASRLESATKKLSCQLVISQSTAEAASLDEEIGAKSRIAVKGRGARVQVIAIDKAVDLPV